MNVCMYVCMYVCIGLCKQWGFSLWRDFLCNGYICKHHFQVHVVSTCESYIHVQIIFTVFGFWLSIVLVVHAENLCFRGGSVGKLNVRLCF